MCPYSVNTLMVVFIHDTGMIFNLLRDLFYDNIEYLIHDISLTGIVIIKYLSYLTLSRILQGQLHYEYPAYSLF